MILARLTKAVREQSWFAVGLEFIIVILGVVIGFQITAWNETRQDIVLERAYLERLASEFETIQNELEDTQGDLEDARTQAELFLEALDAGDEEAMRANTLALLEVTSVSEVQAQSAALHELVSSGRLGLIRDEGLRSQLANLQLTEADAHGVFDQLKAQQVDIIATLRPHMRVRMDGYSVTAVELGDDLSGMDADLANTLSHAIYVNSTASLFIAVLRNRVAELQEALDEELGGAN